MLGLQTNSTGEVDTNKQEKKEQDSDEKNPFRIRLGTKPFSKTSSSLSTSEKIISPLYRHLAPFGSKLVTIDAFEHLKCHPPEATTTASSAASNASRTIKLELVYGDGDEQLYYWPVKVKKCNQLSSGLYQLKLASVDQTLSNNLLDSSLNSSIAEKSTNSTKNAWYFFDISKTSGNLKPLGWGKENGRVAKRPPDDLDLASLLNHPHNHKSDSSTSVLLDDDQLSAIAPSFEENSVCQVWNDNSNEFLECRVKRNVNGRLLLEFVKSGVSEWMFCTDARLKLNSNSNIENLASKNICEFK